MQNINMYNCLSHVLLEDVGTLSTNMLLSSPSIFQYKHNLDFVLVSLFWIGPVLAPQLNVMQLYYPNLCFVKHKLHHYHQISKAAFISDHKSIIMQLLANK